MQSFGQRGNIYSSVSNLLLKGPRGDPVGNKGGDKKGIIKLGRVLGQELPGEGKSRGPWGGPL